MCNKKIWIDCTGDVVQHDVIRFDEIVWGGSYRKPKKMGYRKIVAEVLRDSYGEKKQQHTFTLKVIKCVVSNQYYNIDIGKEIRRKGRNVYRYGTERKMWDNEDLRNYYKNEKYQRGDRAREIRDKRKERETEIYC